MPPAPALAVPADSALPAAVQWFEDVLLGPAANGLAVVAVAWLGFQMLAGRIDWRRGLQVLLGLFILFGAPTMVRELMGAVRVGGGAELAGPAQTPVPPALPSRAPAFDPYAGAAVPGVEEAR